MTINNRDADNAEQEHLLVHENRRNEADEAGTSLTSPPTFSHVVLYFIAIHFLLAFCEMILVAPLIKLFENLLCLTFYDFPIAGVEEILCKVPEIQRPLATIRGWKSSFDMIAVLLVAIPFGRLGDRLGRRKIMALAVLGVVLSLVEIFFVCKKYCIREREVIYGS
ncbi:uncharacterized protein LY89DRAFT_602527 [Mollisia scopiformis]|uniref:Major facilitator superfamily (MFS) profile domain-containing protein n=1 Tax=Mollisia scopiformis TaxID=149040 RepID=A0A132B535_MOLSC|nr:uncharacterized protein LY89DRAFT_602527 [Mollisia scopiformis]KUJ06787.1 hypothetical protein LY89DRAFT_602527 [Mollisia scopiformis]